jgi:hypothetical protein
LKIIDPKSPSSWQHPYAIWEFAKGGALRYNSHRVGAQMSELDGRIPSSYYARSKIAAMP